MEIQQYPSEETGYESYADSQDLQVGSSITLYVYLTQNTFKNIDGKYNGHFACCIVANL